jgi:DNA replication and repair protein RecF
LKHTARLMGDADLRRDSALAKCALALSHVRLVNFRSYRDSEFAVSPVPVVLAGANGTGKTNLLEAISLLSPGRGLRGAKLADIQRKMPVDAAAGTSTGVFGDSLWAVSARLERADGHWEIGTGLTVQAQSAARRRALHLNGAPAETGDLVELLPILWLTPTMDRLFTEGAGERRRFLDRLVFAFDCRHAKRVARYERAAQERLRLLRDRVRDPVWLEALEETMAAEGGDISAARASTIEWLNTELTARGVQGAFPCAQLALKRGPGESEGEAGALKSALAASRERDAEAGRTLMGPHLADLEARHAAKRTDARDCSTGEQKALLISIVLASAGRKKKRARGAAPLLLLDEIAAHLDAHRRAALFEEIQALEAQAWLTGTDRQLFAPLLPHAQCFAVAGGQFVRQD